LRKIYEKIALKLEKKCTIVYARCTVVANKFSQDFVYVKYVIKQIVCVVVKHIINPEEYVQTNFCQVLQTIAVPSCSKWTVLCLIN